MLAVTEWTLEHQGPQSKSEWPAFDDVGGGVSEFTANLFKVALQPTAPAATSLLGRVLRGHPKHTTIPHVSLTQNISLLQSVNFIV